MEVSMAQILDARERRVSRQQTLMAQRDVPLLCFTMNIPGPEKDSPLIRQGFRLGCQMLSQRLAAANIPVLHEAIYRDPTGPEGYFLLDASPADLKTLAVEIEDSLPLGRLFDMDVLTRDGKLSREQLGLPGRKCLLCHKPVYLCASRRAHPLKALQQKTQALLCDVFRYQQAQAIGQLARECLLQEVAVTPKPGLVDRRNTGSHRDMDYAMFQKSAHALTAYFVSCAQLGLDTAQEAPTEVFAKLRPLGRQAEAVMYRATNGVNTHKGAIFCLGLLCAAAGRLPQEARSPANLCREAAALCAGITRELNIPTENPTAGQRLYLAHGVTGVRGEAEGGFPTVLKAGLPAYEAALSQGKSHNDAALAALLAIIAQGTDTNLMARGGFDTARQVTCHIATLIKNGPCLPVEALEILDDAFIARNLSPGGSADLLACTLFLHGCAHIPTC